MCRPLVKAAARSPNANPAHQRDAAPGAISHAHPPLEPPRISPTGVTPSSKLALMMWSCPQSEKPAQERRYVDDDSMHRPRLCSGICCLRAAPSSKWTPCTGMGNRPGIL